MYFELSQKNNNNFTLNFSIKNYILSTDLGWQSIDGLYGKIIYKGYAYQNLANFLKNHDPDKLDSIKGSFTAVMEKNNNIYLVTDNNREFPVYVDRDRNLITNLVQQKEIFWADNLVYIDSIKNKIHCRHNEVKFAFGPPQSLEETTEKILTILNKSIKDFTALYNYPIKIVPTAGLDSTLVIALLKHNNVNFEVIDYEYKKWTYFYLKNKSRLRDLLAAQPVSIFSKIGHSWGEVPKTLANGWQGEQYFGREYLTLAILCKIKKIDLKKEISNFRNAYAYDFMIEEISKRESQWQEITNDVNNKESAYKKIIEIAIASFETWSVEETCYWSPLKDIKILQNILHMNDVDIITNALCGTIQKKIIEKIDPDLLDFITLTKNNYDSLNQTSYQKYIG
jgi:hypothetical protein